jgi:hypothetical protein
MDSATISTTRPAAVTSAGIVFVMSAAVSTVTFVAHSHPRNPVGYILVPLFVRVIIGLNLAPLWFAFWGKNWARWVIASIQTAGLLAFNWGLRRMQARTSHWEVSLYCVQTAVELFATALLFLPGANRWYKGRSKPVSPQLPVLPKPVVPDSKRQRHRLMCETQPPYTKTGNREKRV